MKKRIIIALLLVLLTGLAIWTLWANSAVEMNTVVLKDHRIPAGFEGFRIAHVSDLHSAAFYEDVLALLEQAEPDIICITGDLMDCRDTSAEIALDFAARAEKIAPCYYVTGNHEVSLEASLYRALIDGLKEAGVTVLEDTQVLLERQGDMIALAGHCWGDSYKVGDISDFEGFRILLSHVPEDFHLYAAAGFHLSLSGHAHGGQIRLPFIGGLYAPGQGIFPRLDGGLYTENGMHMVVSRGIGNSSFPLRFNNRPEVVLITLEG